MNENHVEKNLALFEGQSFLHIGANNTFGDLADAILNKLSEVEAKCLITTLKKNMSESKFLKQEKELQALIKKCKVEAEI